MINAQGLAKKFGAIQAVSDFTLHIESGEIVALLGPNGAGKTTVMRLLTGFLTPDAGSASLAGFDSRVQAIMARQRLGYLPEHAPIYRESEVLAYLRFIADARQLAGARKAVDDICDRLSLNAIAYQPIATLSKGAMRRVALAAAVLHRPQVLLLDEPTEGLDPNQKQQVRDLIRTQAKHSAVLLSTHQIDEVLSLCPRTAIMAKGRLLLDESTDELLQRSKYHNAVSFIAAESIAARAALDGLSGISGFEQNAADGRLYVFAQGSKPQNQLIAERLLQRQVPFSDLRLEYGRLDEVFTKIVAEAA
jgi:ABC-2 type transport system ATP-binding protein